MRFLVLMAEPDHFGRWERATTDEQEAAGARMDSFATAVREHGRIVHGEALAASGEARTLRPGSERVVTEGPFAETVEQIGGIYLVDLPDLATAVKLADLLPPSYTIEVRPVIDVS